MEGVPEKSSRRLWAWHQGEAATSTRNLLIADRKKQRNLEKEGSKSALIIILAAVMKHFQMARRSGIIQN